MIPISAVCFLFNDTATTEIYPLSLHDALPIWWRPEVPDRHRRSVAAVALAAAVAVATVPVAIAVPAAAAAVVPVAAAGTDRQSTRLNSSHAHISYAVFCFTKKNCTTSLAPGTP